MSNSKPNNVIDILKKTGLKATPKRMYLLDFFSTNKKPISAEDIFKKAKDIKIDLVTIYRTLASFEKVGILRKIDLRKDSVFYELAWDHHHHIVCTDCGNLEDFDLRNEKAIFSQVIKNSKNFKKISDHSLELFGTCKKCLS